MLAVEAHILAALQKQRTAEAISNYPYIASLLERTENTLQRQVDELEAANASYDNKPTAEAKQTITQLFGAVAGFYNKFREHTLSRMLRDNYTALSLAAISNTMMHAYAVSVQEYGIADMAKRHIDELSNLIADIRKAIPEVVIGEVDDTTDFPVNKRSIGRATVSSEQAWSSRPATSDLLPV